MSRETDVAQDFAREAATLRLPVPFFDLLMVLLVTCLVFVSPIPPDAKTMQSIDIAIAQGKGEQSADALLPVIPRQTARGWVFESTADKQQVDASALAARAAAEGRKVVLVLPAATALQQFVEMQSTLAAAHMPFAIAIKNKE